MERGVQIEVTQLKRGLLLICSESIRSGIYTEPHRVEARFYADLVKTKGWTHFQRHTKPQLTPYICLPVARSVISAPAEVTALALQGASLSAPQLTQGSSARCKPEREQRTPWWLARARGSACAGLCSASHQPVQTLCPQPLPWHGAHPTAVLRVSQPRPRVADVTVTLQRHGCL